MKTEYTIKSLELYYESMLALMPGNVYWKDREGILQGCNNNLAKLLNLPSRKAIIGKTDEDITSKKEARLIKKRDFEVMRTGIEQTNEETYTLPNGTVITYLTQRSPILNKYNEVIGLIGISFNISDRKKMEQDLILSKEKAEAANYIMTEFISNMGHLLVTPFSGITGTASILLYGYADRYLELKPLFVELMHGCMAWEKVYRQIINATSLAEMEVNIETFSINEELSNIASTMKESARAKHLKLIIKPFKPKKEDLIESDRLKFHLILIELIDNAIKFTENGQITVCVFREDNWFHIQVIDTGIGIPADKLDYIFKQYTMLSRAQKHGANFRGVGAGLFLAKQRAKLLDSKISVTSELNVGSRFTFSLPIHPAKQN